MFWELELFAIYYTVWFPRNCGESMENKEFFNLIKENEMCIIWGIGFICLRSLVVQQVWEKNRKQRILFLKNLFTRKWNLFICPFGELE